DRYALVRVCVLGQVLDRGLARGPVRRAPAAPTSGGVGNRTGRCVPQRLVCVGPSSPRGTAAGSGQSRKGRSGRVPPAASPAVSPGRTVVAAARPRRADLALT